jgi:F0F1-type ATP synthase membrane subunit c/vacuolar-type H+-ATPase subunit K
MTQTVAGSSGSSGSSGSTGSSGSSGSAGSADSSNEHLSAVFIGIVLVEALSIAGLYWLGVHFV